MDRFHRILCHVRPGDDREQLIARAVVIAEEQEAELTLIDVVGRLPTRFPMRDGLLTQELLEAARRADLERLAEHHRKRCPIAIRIRRGDGSLQVIRDVLELKHDLVIAQTDRDDLASGARGSEEMQLLRKCPCPVWILKPPFQRSCRRVLAAVDVDQQRPASELPIRDALNRHIVELAFSIALPHLADLHIVHAWVPPNPLHTGLGLTPVIVEEYNRTTEAEHVVALDALLTDLGADAGGRPDPLLSVTLHRPKESARRAIPTLADELDIDLVVMGSVARTGVAGLLIGNTAEAILHRLDRSVLVVKPEGFETPVERSAR